MKTIYTVLALLAFLAFVICSYYYLFYSPLGFTFQLNDYGQYFPVFVTLCGWSLFLILKIPVAKKAPFSERLLLVIINICILCLVAGRYYSFANEYFTTIVVAVLLLAMLLSAGIEVLHALLLCFAAMFMVELYLACKQMSAIRQLSFRAPELTIQGTLQNPGIFSWYMVSQLPFLYYLVFCVPAVRIRGKQLTLPKQLMPFLKSVKVIVFVMVLALVAAIIWQSQSRIAMIALGALLLSFFVMHYGKAAKLFIYKLPKAITLPAAGVLAAGLCFAGWYLFNLKKLSAITRVMTLDIAKDHFTDHCWLGTGIGRMPWYYPQWQAQYFATHSHPPHYYFLSADESYYLFNEYAELFCTTGLPGFIAFIFLLIWFFTARSVKHTALLQAAKLTVIGILVCGISAYPFHVTFLLLLLACCFATAAMVNENRWRLLQAPRLPDRLSNIAGRLLQMVLIVIAVVAAYVAFGQWRAKKDWDKLRNQLFSSRAEIHAGYRQLYNTLHYDGKFLTDYGMFLAEDSADCPKAVAVLEEAKKYVITRVAIETLAQAYKKTGNYQKAIENYQWLCNYLPNKFGTKLELLTLYVAVNDSVNARKTAHTILTMPVKIPSREVDRIKNETTGILQRLH